MDHEEFEKLKSSIQKLAPESQDRLAGFLLIERLKRNQLILPNLHQRIDNADTDKWTTWEKAQQSLTSNNS